MRKSSMHASTFSLAPVTTLLSSSSTGSETPASRTTPSKYLRVMARVRRTRLPNVLARSELTRSVTSSQVMVPSPS